MRSLTPWPQHFPPPNLSCVFSWIKIFFPPLFSMHIGLSLGNTKGCHTIRHTTWPSVPRTRLSSLTQRTPDVSPNERVERQWVYKYFGEYRKKSNKVTGISPSEIIGVGKLFAPRPRECSRVAPGRIPRLCLALLIRVQFFHLKVALAKKVSACPMIVVGCKQSSRCVHTVSMEVYIFKVCLCELINWHRGLGFQFWGLFLFQLLQFFPSKGHHLRGLKLQQLNFEFRIYLWFLRTKILSASANLTSGRTVTSVSRKRGWLRHGMWPQRSTLQQSFHHSIDLKIQLLAQV